MKQSFKLGVTLALFAAAFAQAETVDLFDAMSVTAPEFDYTKASGASPVLVDVLAENGACHFQVSLIGHQQSGSVPDVSLTGRVESGECHGVKVKQGLVRASVSPKDWPQVVLNRRMDVVVLDGLHGRMGRASN